MVACATTPWDRLEGRLALRVRQAIDFAERDTRVSQVLAASDRWTSNFEGAQFTLGHAWYTHLEEGRSAHYFASADESDRVVEEAAPGLQERMFALASRFLGAPVNQRRGWCGPGVHVFRPRSLIARRGGEVHFDTEGLTDGQLERRAPALTFVLMLQPAESGGGLRVWDRLYDGEDFPAKPGPDVPVTQIAYEPGELVVIDSYRLHQILPFSGRRDRISATMHVALEAGAWEGWF
jgi:hypothetical protein